MSEAAPPEASWSELARGGRLTQFSLLCLGIWLHAADSLLVATAMPSAVAEIGGGHLVAWTLSLYLLGSIVSAAAAALGASALGIRRAFAGAAAVYAVGCGISALAPDMIVMLGGRLLQGLGGGWLVALTYVAIQRLFAPEMWPRLIAVMSAIWGASAFCGPLIGGFFADLGLWRWGFWAFAAQAAFLCVMVPLVMKPTARGARVDVRSVPVVRISVLSAAVLFVAGAGVSVTPAISIPMAATGVVAFWLFLRLDATRGTGRMFPSRAFDVRHLLGAGFVANLALGAATTSFAVYGPFLLNELHGVTALGAGYIIAAESIAWSTTAVAFAGATPDGERGLIRMGATMIVAAIVGFAFVMADGPLWTIVVAALAQGAGFGMVWGFLVRRVVAAAPAAERDCASSAMPTTQQIAFALGAAVSGIVANAAGFADGIDAQSAERAAFWVFAAFAPLGILGAVAAWRATAE